MNMKMSTFLNKLMIKALLVLFTVIAICQVATGKMPKDIISSSKENNISIITAFMDAVFENSGVDVSGNIIDDFLGDIDNL